MNVQAIPRSIISGYLGAARLPLSVLARLRGEQGNDKWPPALAFEGFEGGVQTVLGSLLRDDTLLAEGRLRQAKVAQLRKAERLETLADAERAQAQEEFAERREQAERERLAASQRAQQREQQVEREAEQRKRQADQRAAKKKTAARQTKAAADKVIERRERALTADALDAEADALKTTQQALDAAETVDVIDSTIEGTKADRKTG